MENQPSHHEALKPEANPAVFARVWLVSAIGLLLLAIFVWVPTTRVFNNVDPFVYGTAARQLLAGQKLYMDFFESKPPLMTLAYAIPGFLCHGQEKSGNGMTVLLVLTLFVQAAIWIYFLKPGRLAGLAITLFLVIYPATYPDFAWASSEHLSNIFISLILIFSWLGYRDGSLSPGRMFAMGAATCTAFHLRQNCLLAGLVPLWVLLISRQPVRIKLNRFGWFVIGGLAVWALILGIVLVISNVPDYFYQTFIFPKKFAVYDGNLWSRRMALHKQFNSASDAHLTWILALVAVFALWNRARLFVFPAMVIGVSYCCISPRPHGTYLINLFPFMALAFLIAPELKLGKWRLNEWLCLVTVALASSISSANPSVRSPAPLKPMNSVVDAVNRLADKNDTLFVNGTLNSGYIQLCADPLPANKYPFAWSIDYNSGMMPDGTAAILESYVKHPPNIMVLDKSVTTRIGYAPLNHEPSPSNPATVLVPIFPQGWDSDGYYSQSDRLTMLLITKHHYEAVWDNSHYLVLRLHS